MADSTPYSTAKEFFGGSLPQWLNSYDAERLASYKLYKDIYDGNPGTFTVMLRGGTDRPIYIPSAKQIINTMGRYVGRGWGFSVDPSAGSESEQATAIQAFGDLFNREKMLAQFASNKRSGLILGDWAWYIVANPLKQEGRRISVRSIDPGMVFPIHDPDDLDSQIGVDLIEQTQLPDGKTYIKRQRYLKPSHPLHPNAGSFDAPVAYESLILDTKDWEDPKKAKKVKTLVPMQLLPAQITALPVYHLRNNVEPGNPFGSSELRGLERLLAAVNQAITDEDLSLAMAGLGMYATDGGAPVNDAGDEVDWDLGPGRVVEVGAGRSFTRVSGVASVSPSQDHLGYLEKQMFRTSGISDVALGQVDVSVAESGIALALRMGPLIDAAEEKDLEVTGVMNQFLFDLRSWFAAYEGLNLDNVGVASSLGEKLPVDRAARFKELMDLLAGGLVDKEYCLDALTKEFGYQFPANMLARLDAAAQQAAALADPYADRLANPDGEQEPANDELG